MRPTHGVANMSACGRGDMRGNAEFDGPGYSIWEINKLYDNMANPSECARSDDEEGTVRGVDIGKALPGSRERRRSP